MVSQAWKFEEKETKIKYPRIGKLATVRALRTGNVIFVGDDESRRR